MGTGTSCGAWLKKWRLSFLCLLVAGCGQALPVVKIGFVAPLTGDQAPQGEDMLRGAQLAIEHAQAEGPVLPGARLALLALDDQRNPTQAVAAAKRLVADPDVVAVVGHLNSSCTMPASAIYHEAGLLHMNPVSSNPQLSRQGFKNFFRVCATDDLQGPAAAKFAREQLGLTTAFVIDDMTTYGRGLAHEFAKAWKASGGQVVGNEGITQGDKDFAPLLTRLKTLPLDLIFFAGMFPEGALLIKQKAEVGLPGVFIGGDGLFDSALIELATPQAAEGVYLTNIGADVRLLPSARAFVQAYEERFGPVGAYSAYAYEATRIAVWAVRAAGQKNRAAVLSAMQGFEGYPGLFGIQQFDAQGDSLIRDIGIFNVQEGQFQFVTTATR